MATKGIDDCLKKLKAEVDIEPEVEYYLRAKARPYLDQGIPEKDAYKKAILEFQKETIETVKSVYAQVGAKGYSQTEGAEIPASATVSSGTEAAPLTQPAIEEQKTVFRAMSESELENANKIGEIKSNLSMALPIEQHLGLTGFAETAEETMMYANLNLQRGGKSYIAEIEQSPEMRSDYGEAPMLLAERNELAKELQEVKKTLTEKGQDWESREQFEKWAENNEAEIAKLDQRLKDIGLTEEQLKDAPKGFKLPYKMTPKGVPVSNIKRLWEVKPDGTRTEVDIKKFTSEQKTPAATQQQTSTPAAKENVEGKKADIEKRRQAELKESYELDLKNAFSSFPDNYFETPSGKKAKEIFDDTYQQRYSSGIQNINSKYDAELSALEKQTQQQTSTPIGESKDEKVEIPRQDKINDLVERVNVFNKMPRNAKGRSQEINSIRVAANELGLRFDDRSGELFNKNGGKVKKVNADAPRKAAEGFNQENYSDDTRKHFEVAKNNLDALTGLPIKDANGHFLNRKQLEAAVKSIEDGKPNNAAKAIFDYLEGAVNEGSVEITDRITGDRATIPIQDYFDAFKEPVADLTYDEVEQLNYELDQDSFNFTEDYGQEIIPTKIEADAARPAEKSPAQTGGGKEAARSGAKAQEAEQRLKAAQSNYDKAAAALQDAEDKIAKKKSTQADIFGGAKVQKEMFGIGRDEAKEILDPLKQKVKETKAELEAAQKAATVPDNQPELISDEVGKPPTKEPPPEDEDMVADEEDEKPSGIKKALVSNSIIKSVDLDKVSDEEMMALGRKILDTGEVNPRALVQKITTERKGVLTPAEVVALITYKADLDNKLRDTYTEINKRNESGEDIGTLGVEAKNLERDILDFDIMSVITAQQQSLAFRLRQQMLDRDYNVVTEIEKYKANNGGYIPPDVEEKFKELGKQLKEVKEKLAEAEKRASEKEAQEAVDNIKESVDREKKYTDEEIEKKIEKGVQDEINKIYQQLPGDKKSLADKAIAALDKIQKNLRGKQYSDVTGFVAIIDAGITTIKNAIKLGVSVKEAVELGIKKIKEKLGGKDWPKEDEFRKDMIDGFESEGVSVRKDKPVINDDGTVTVPNKVLRDLVEKGITDINELTDAVHAIVVKDLPDVSKRQIRDYITDYGRKVNPTADGIQQQVNEAKRIGRLLSELEDLMNKKRKEKNPSTHAKLTEKERELKRQIKSLEKDIFGKEELTDEQKLSNAKESVRARIAELDRRIKNKDFAKPKKKLAKIDDELAALNAEKEKLQDQFDDEQYKLTLKNRTFWQKAEDVLLELTSGLIRGLVASIDLSAGLIQGFWRLFTDPKKSMRAYGVMFKHLISENNSQDFLNKLKAQKYYPLLQASKLAIDDKTGRVSAKEGLFISNWINFIWDKGISNVLGLGTRPGVRFFRKINPYAASQRAFDGYVNSIRVQSFLQLAKELERDGYKFEADQAVFEKAADFVNTTTGRGSLGAADASSRWLNIFLFAPRKVISEIKLFTPYAFVYYARMPKAVRKKALINFAKFAASYFGVNALLWAARKDWDDDEEDNFWNMNSSDFLTHKIGNKRVSIGGGMKSALVMQGRFWSGEFTDQYGNTTKLGDRFGKQINTRLDLMWRYVLGKASPALGVAAKKLDERKGLEVDDASIMKDLTMPIWLQDIKDLYKESPETVSGLLTFLSILGANARNVDQTKRTQKSIKIYDPKTRTSRDSTPEEYKNYTDKRDELASKMLEDIKKNDVMFDEYGEITVNKDDEKSRRNRRKYESLSEDEKKDLMTKINNSVDDKAKAELKFFTKQQAQGQD